MLELAPSFALSSSTRFSKQAFFSRRSSITSSSVSRGAARKASRQICVGFCSGIEEFPVILLEGTQVDGLDGLGTFVVPVVFAAPPGLPDPDPVGGLVAGPVEDLSCSRATFLAHFPEGCCLAATTQLPINPT